MRKISYILISGCITLSIIGCDETFDTSNTSEGILSLSENGLTILQSYNVGEKYNADLWIQHGGLELNNSTVTFTVDKKPARLTQYCRRNQLPDTSGRLLSND